MGGRAVGARQRYEGRCLPRGRAVGAKERRCCCCARVCWRPSGGKRTPDARGAAVTHGDVSFSPSRDRVFKTFFGS